MFYFEVFRSKGIQNGPNIKLFRFDEIATLFILGKKRALKKKSFLSSIINRYVEIFCFFLHEVTTAKMLKIGYN